MYTRGDDTTTRNRWPYIRPVPDLFPRWAFGTASRAKRGRSEYMGTGGTGRFVRIPRSTPARSVPTPPTPKGWGVEQVGERYGVEREEQMAADRQGRADLDTPWDELTDEQKDRATDWAREVMELSRRVDRFEQELDNALERQEMTEMEQASSGLYRTLGHPDGYQYRGGPVGWDGAGA